MFQCHKAHGYMCLPESENKFNTQPTTPYKPGSPMPNISHMLDESPDGHVHEMDELSDPSTWLQAKRQSVFTSEDLWGR